MRTLGFLIVSMLLAWPSPPSQSVVVTEYVSVLRADGTPVTGLSREAFNVSADDVPVAVEGVGPSGPLAIALVLDATSSMRRNLKMSAGDLEKSFLSRLRPADRVRVLTVSPSPMVGRTFTNDRSALKSAISEALGSTRTGPSPIWDTIRQAGQSLAAEPGPRVIVLSSDGRATGNANGYDETLRELSVAGITVGAIAAAGTIAVEQTKQVAIVQPDGALRHLALITGGPFYFDRSIPGINPRALEARRKASGAASADLALPVGIILERIITELQGRYAIRFSTPSDGRFHRLKVGVNIPDATVHARELFLAK